MAFDPTPRPEAAMGFAAGRDWVYFGLEDFTGVTFASMVSPLAGNFSFGSLSMRGWGWGMLLAGGIVAVVLALLLIRRRVRTRQETREYTTLDGESRRTMLSLYRKMVATLVRKGLPSRQPYQPPYEYAAIVCSQIPHSRETVEWLTQAASRAAYDSRPFHSATVLEAR